MASGGEDDEAAVGQRDDFYIPEEISLFCLPRGNPVRELCISIYTNHYFHLIILAIILSNTLSMLLQYSKVPGIGDVLWAMELTFTTAFTLELIIKATALGFVWHKGSYLREGWNVLDCVIVVASLMSQAKVASNFSVIRLLRVLRPLRTLSRVKGMRALMGALFVSIPQIVDNVFLLVFIIFVFAILGIQLFSGVLHRTCIIIEADNNVFPSLQLPSLIDGSPQACGGSSSCTPIPNAVVECLIDTDLFSETPLNYDNIGRALLLVFKVVSQDDWPEDMDKLMSSSSSYSWVFYISCTVLGAFFGTNMFLAVLITAYYNNKSKMERHTEDEAVQLVQRNSEAPMLLTILRSFKKRGSQSNREKEGPVPSMASSRSILSAVSDEVVTALPLPTLTVSPETPAYPMSDPDQERREISLFGAALEKEDNTDNNELKPMEIPQIPMELDPPGRHSFLHKVMFAIETFIMHKYTEQVVLFATLVNILVLAIDHHEINKDLAYILDMINMTCTLLFTVEITLKIAGLGPKRTFKDGYNCFDFFLVAIAVPDLLSGSSSAFTALRAFRMLRALRVVRRWPSIHKLLRMTTSCFKEGAYVSLVVVLQIFIFSILGMEFFEGKFPMHVRPNFNTLWEAALTCFVIITGESWAGVMKNGMLSTNDWSALYFLLLFMTGNLVLINVFIAIILDKMDESMFNEEEEDNGDEFLEISGCSSPRDSPAFQELKKTTEEGGGFHDINEMFRNTQNSKEMQHQQLQSPIESEEFRRKQRLRRMTKTNEDGSLNLTVLKKRGWLGLILKKDEKLGNIVVQSVESKSPAEKAGLEENMVLVAINDTPVGETVEDTVNILQKLDTFTLTVKIRLFTGQQSNPKKPVSMWTSFFFSTKDYQLLGTTFGCVPNDSPARVFTSRIVHSKAFDYFIILSIIGNLVLLMLQHPKAGSTMEMVFLVSDYVFTLIFVSEMLVKIYVLGLWNPSPAVGAGYPPDVAKPYMRDIWNRVDAFVAVSAAVGLFAPGFTVFRSLRTVRLIIKSNELRIIVESLMRCLPSVTRSIVLCGFLLFVFGILGVQLFKGTFYQCNDPTIEREQNCTGSFLVETHNTTSEKIRVWGRYTSHFDHLGASIFTLFEVAVGDGWAAIMYHGIDSTSVGNGPSYNNRPQMALFFVVFYVIGNFFAMNLIVGTLISEFLKTRIELGPWAILSESQREFLTGEKQFRKILFCSQSAVPTTSPRMYFHKLMQHPFFDPTITTCILLNIVTLSTIHYRQKDEWTSAQEVTNYVFTMVFILEAVVKIVAMGTMYWKENWNKFDFTIVVVATTAMFVPQLEGASSVRVLRVGRLFRLIKKAKGLQKLFDTMFQDENLLFFANAGMLLLSIFFVFGVAGVDLFGTLPHKHALSNNYNFDTVPQAMLTLFTVSTTEGWIDIRESTTTEGHELYAVYFILFMIIGSFMMLNLFAAVVVEILQEQDANDKNSDKIEALGELKLRWEARFGKDCKTVNVQTLVDEITKSGRSASCTEHLIPQPLRALKRLRSSSGQFDPFVMIPSTTSDYVGLLAYLSTLPIPVSSTHEVNFTDFIECYAARLYGMQMEDIALVSRLKLTKMAKSHPEQLHIGHWFAAEKIRRTWIGTRRKKLEARKKPVSEKPAAEDNAPPTQSDKLCLKSAVRKSSHASDNSANSRGSRVSVRFAQDDDPLGRSKYSASEGSQGAHSPRATTPLNSHCSATFEN